MQGIRNNGASTWGGKYSNEGQVDFTLQGTVNGIREDANNEVDYVEFFITNPIKNDKAEDRTCFKQPLKSAIFAVMISPV